MNRITLDFETRSMCDLKKEGAYKYSVHPSTKPTCLVVKRRDHTGSRLFPFQEINRLWQDLDLTFRVAWKNHIKRGTLFVAQNAFFEICIYKNIMVTRYGWPDIAFRQWRCTAAKAAACALPRSLEGSGHALNLTTQKDPRGYVAMMATCKPTKHWTAWRKAREEIAAGRKVGARKRTIAAQPEPPIFLEPDQAPDVWRTLYTYCRIDVKTEELLDETLPDLIPSEQEVWFLNQQLNWRGFRVDVKTARKVVDIMSGESESGLQELDTLTMGLVTKAGARQSILDFLALEGVLLPDIRAQTVNDILAQGELSEDMQRLLEIRRALSKTSTKKFQSFLDRAGKDERVRDILLYHGASTGRDTGTGIQPHNFPKGVISVDSDRPYAAIENVIECDKEMLKILYGDNLSLLFSSILRNMILPTEGWLLFVADFSKIEVAILWWLADNWEGLKVLITGKDPYIYQAAKNLNKTYEEVEKAYHAKENWAEDGRQLGKAQILGAGFRMAWKRFKDTAWSMYRMRLTSRQSVDAIKSYRLANAPVVDLWEIYNDAALDAVKSPGKTILAGKCEFKIIGRFLTVKLPSGRMLRYLSPSIQWRVITFTALEEDAEGNEIEVERTSQPKETLQFLGLAISKKTMQVEFTHGGILTENIVQAVARDLMKNGERLLEKAGYRVLLSVHDELICEKETGSVIEFTKIMCSRPAWVDEHLPIEAKGWSGPRYRKG